MLILFIPSSEFHRTGTSFSIKFWASVPANCLQMPRMLGSSRKLTSNKFHASLPGYKTLHRPFDLRNSPQRLLPPPAPSAPPVPCRFELKKFTSTRDRQHGRIQAIQSLISFDSAQKTPSGLRLHMSQLGKNFNQSNQNWSIKIPSKWARHEPEELLGWKAGLKQWLPPSFFYINQKQVSSKKFLSHSNPLGLS